MTASYLQGLGLGLMLGCAAALPAAAKDIVWARYGDIDTLDPHRARHLDPVLAGVEPDL